MPELDQVLDAIECLAGRHRTVTALPGGLTNTNLRVRTDEVDVVVRISPPSTGRLAVDRECEYLNSLAAAAAGVGAPVVDYLPGRGVLVVEFIPEAATFDEEGVARHTDRIAAALRRLHAGPSFANRFDIFDIGRRYLAIMEEPGFHLPDRYVDVLPTAGRMEAALRERPESLVPCHNDLLAANFLDDGNRIWIIDYEYSGNNEPGFELGNIAQESHLGDDDLAALVHAYYGQDAPGLVARARLWAVASAFVWTLWGTIQERIAPVDHDFRAWGLEKFARAEEAMADRDFGLLLDTVAGAR
ncbi:MAG: phosphotransferase [Tetrasphaera sp.]|jgi:thiamine kinase-like enzyme|nr:phosphotransferase [Tetrasphaera sp.]